MDNNIYVSAVIVAAGASSRMKSSKSKMLIEINGKPVIYHTLKAMERCDLINEYIVVCRDEEREEFSSIVTMPVFTKFKCLAKGGITRQNSVFNGTVAVSRKTTHILIHDGARPLVTQKEIENTINSAIKFGAAAVGVKVKDTIKIIDENNIVKSTPNRENLIAVHTPQCFERSMYMNAINKAFNENKLFTDDCQIIENIGKNVYITVGEYTNIKITTPEDLIFAEKFISKGGNIK